MTTLRGLRVVELSAGGAAAWATKHLADFGADVHLLEPAGGSPLRSLPPYYERGGVRTSATWAWLSRGKTATTVGGAAGAAPAAAALAYCRSSDLVVIDREAAFPVLGLSPAELRAELEGHTSCIVISPFSFDGPSANDRASDLGIQARSGWCNIIGDPLREPLRPGYDLSPRIGGLFAFVAGLVALRHRRQGGEPQFVELSLQAASASMLAGPWLMKRMLGVERSRRGNWWPLGGVMACADGWVGCTPLTGAQWETMCRMMGIEDVLEEPGGLEPAYREAHGTELLERMQPWLSATSKFDCFEQAQVWRIPAAPVEDVAERLACPQLEARGFWRRADIDGESVRVPRVPFLIEGVEPVDRQSLREEPLPPAQAPPPARGEATGVKPYAGIRILDLTHFWSGPAATMMLGALGADVIKVESTRRADPYRYSVAPFGDERWYERGAYWNDTNCSKRGITLDLGAEAGRRLFEQLVARSDVVISNFSNRVMPNFGFDKERLLALNPRLIVVELPGYGMGGPWQDYVGYGLAFEQLAVSASLTGYAGGAPTFVGGFCDPVCGLHVVAAIDLALQERERSSSGLFVEAPQCEILDSLYAPEHIAVQMGAPVPGRRGNRHEWMAPHNAYQVAGDDRWVSIAVADDREFGALCRVLGCEDIARDSRFASAAARKQHEPELDALLSAAIAGRDGAAMERSLQEAGVMCCRVAKGWELPEDDDLRHLGFFQELTRPITGTHPYKTWPFRFSSLDVSHSRPPPLLGEHNDEVLGGLLGLAPEELARLEQEGVIGAVLREGS